MPSIAAVTKTAVCFGVIACCCGLILTGSSIELNRSEQHIDIVLDGKPFSTYYFDPAVAKPYLMPLRTASGIIVTRGFPTKNNVSAGDPKADAFEPHQRPLYFGHGDLDGLDFWQEPVFDKFYTDHGHQAYGHLVLEAIDQPSTEGAKHILARFTLNTSENRVIGEETQSFSFSGDEHTRLIDCEFNLNATAGPLDIGDTKEGTFAIRLAPELSAPLGRMINSKGAVGEKAIWGKSAEWVDYSGSISGKRVDVAIFDSPKSFRHPTTWHARAYGLFAANPFGLREFTGDASKDGSWTVPEGKSIAFRYHVLIHEGDFGPDQISEAYKQYVADGH